VVGCVCDRERERVCVCVCVRESVCHHYPPTLGGWVWMRTWVGGRVGEWVDG